MGRGKVRRDTTSKRPGCPRPCAASRGDRCTQYCRGAGMEQHCAKASGHAGNCRVRFGQGCPTCTQASRGIRSSSLFGASVGSPPRPAPPRHSRIADRRACVHCIAVLEALARTSATGYDAQDPQSKKVRRKQRPLRGADAARSASKRRIAAAIPSQQTANTQGRKKSVSVVGGGTLAGRTV